MKLKPRYSKKLKSSSFEKYNIYPRKVPKQALYCVPETIVFMCLYTLTSRWIMQDQKKLCHAAKFSTWDPRINTCMCFKQNGTKQHRKQHRQQRPDSFNWHFNLNFSLCCQESKLCSNQQIRATWKSLSRIFRNFSKNSWFSKIISAYENTGNFKIYMENSDSPFSFCFVIDCWAINNSVLT